MNAVEAMDGVFAGSFAGDTWRVQRTFLKALHALPLTADEKVLYTRHTGRSDVADSPYRTAALITGRRSAKSRLAGLCSVCAALFRDYRDDLATGEVCTIAVLASDRRQARGIFRYARGLIGSVPRLEREITRETDEIIEFGGRRVVLEIATASIRATRGYTYGMILADEVAFWRDETGANPAEEIFAALRPGLATIPGAQMLLLSSPYAQKGLLYAMFRKHFGQQGASTLIWKASSLEMNPTLDAAEIEADYADDPQRASSEWGGQFRASISSFIERSVLESCIERGRYEIAPQPGMRAVGFVDPSGGVSDSFTCGIAFRDGEKAVLACLRETRPPFSPDNVVQEYAALLKSYGLTTVSGDRYAAGWTVERFKDHGITYKASERSRSQIYADLLPAMNSGRVRLLDNSRLVNQFAGLERRPSRGGQDVVDHGPGGHDDVANAAAGALVGVGAAKRPMRISAAALANV